MPIRTETIIDINSVPLWKSLTNAGSYEVNDIINYNGTLYKNITGTNTNITPDLDTTNWIEIGSAGGSNIILRNPQLFNPTISDVLAGSGNYILMDGNEIGFVSINGQVLDDSEYSLSSTTLTLTPSNGFDNLTDEILVFQHGVGLVSPTIPSTFNFKGGLFDYNDLITSTTPITVTGGAGFVDLTNDGAGAFTNKSYPPEGVTDIWNTTTNLFDFTQLKLGDMVDIRLDLSLITSSVNTEVEVDLLLGSGGSSYLIPFLTETNFKVATTHPINVFNGIYMGDTNTLNNGAKFQIKADKNCTVTVNGWYCKIIQRG